MRSVDVVERLAAADSHRDAAAGHVMIFDHEEEDDGALPAGELLLF